MTTRSVTTLQALGQLKTAMASMVLPLESVSPPLRTPFRAGVEAATRLRQEQKVQQAGEQQEQQRPPGEAQQLLLQPEQRQQQPEQQQPEQQQQQNSQQQPEQQQHCQQRPEQQSQQLVLRLLEKDLGKQLVQAIMDIEVKLNW